MPFSSYLGKLPIVVGQLSHQSIYLWDLPHECISQKKCAHHECVPPLFAGLPQGISYTHGQII